MNYSMNKDNISTNEVLFDGCQEQSIDLDFSLPDYCPDIRRILKCQVYPQINVKNLTADRLDVDGNAIIKLIYVDAIKNTIRCCEYKEPFSLSFNFYSQVENAMAFTKVKVEYMNCRAISPRRLDIHGAFSVCAKVCSKIDQEIVNSVDAEDIQQKKEDRLVSSIVGTGNQQFSVNETVEIGSSNPKIESIIKSNISIELSDIKAIANKIIIKADAFIKILYLSDIDTGNIESAEYTVPISQIVDVPGVDEDSLCDIRVEILSNDIRPKSDSLSEEELLSIDIKFAVMVTAYEKKELQIVSDVYSTKYNLNINHKQTSAPRFVEVISDNYTDKSDVEVSSEGISEIIDVFNEVISASARCEEDKINFKGKMNICILAIDDKGEPFYTERMVDFEHKKDWNCSGENTTCDVEPMLKSMTFRINTKNSVEIKSEISLKAIATSMENFKVIDEISADEDNPKEKDASLTIYYADKGESIWDIARSYCTSVDLIKQENNITEDVLTKRGMLLIPM